MIRSEPNRSNVEPSQLWSYVKRLEALRQEIKERNEDVTSLYKEAKSNGYESPLIKDVVKIRALKDKDAAKFEERETKLDLYLQAAEEGERAERGR